MVFDPVKPPCDSPRFDWQSKRYGCAGKHIYRASRKGFHYVTMR